MILFKSLVVGRSTDYIRIVKLIMLYVYCIFIYYKLW